MDRRQRRITNQVGDPVLLTFCHWRPPAINAQGLPELINSCKEKRIAQVVFGHSTGSGWRKYLYLSAVHHFLRDTPSVDIHIVTQESGRES